MKWPSAFNNHRSRSTKMKSFPNSSSPIFRSFPPAVLYFSQQQNSGGERRRRRLFFLPFLALLLQGGPTFHSSILQLSRHLMMTRPWGGGGQRHQHQPMPVVAAAGVPFPSAESPPPSSFYPPSIYVIPFLSDCVCCFTVVGGRSTAFLQPILRCHFPTFPSNFTEKAAMRHRRAEGISGRQQKNCWLYGFSCRGPRAPLIVKWDVGMVQKDQNWLDVWQCLHIGWRMAKTIVQ